MRWKSHVQCESGEKLEIISNSYLSIFNIIGKFNFPTVLVENVPNFFTSDAGKILMARLNRLGYKTFWDKFDAREFGGLTSRVRGYLFATMLPGNFEMPKPTNKNETPIWELLNFDERIASGELRDVTHTSSLQDGLKTGRARLITRKSLFSGTILKSQNRQAKDSQFIYDEVNEKYYFTSNELLSELMNIEMDFSAVGGTIESEIIGQSIEVPLHDALLDSINQHIMESNQILCGKLF